MCETIERTCETVDLNEIRTLPQRSQFYIEEVSATPGEAIITISGKRVRVLIDDTDTSFEIPKP